MPIMTNTANRIVIRTQDLASDPVTLANGVYNGVTPTGYVITKILWSTANSTTVASVARGANTVFKGTGAGVWDLSAMGITLNVDSTASVVVACANGTVIVEAKKLPAGAAQ